MAEAFTLAFDAPLGSLNTLRVNATASCLATASDPDALPAILGHERLREFPVLIEALAAVKEAAVAETCPRQRRR